MEQLLKLFLKRLVQLDAGNRSLYLPKLSKEKDLDLHTLDFASSKPSFHILERLIAGKSAPLCAITDSRNASGNQSSERLKKILRKQQSITEETGAKDLYVGYPFIRGVAPGGLPIRCPLLFFPVSLEQQANQWVLVPQTDEPVSINKSLLLAYAHFFRTKYDEGLAEMDVWELGTDVLSFRTALYELLKKSSLEINFNQDLFQDKLQYFTEYPKREDFSETHPEGMLKLYPEAVLGIFPQAGSYLEPDYQWLLENPTSDSLESFFEKHQQLPVRPEFLENDTFQSNAYIHLVKEEQTFTPFKIDIFQENAIKAVKYGHSLVVQGPPGTGKSQLICNLAADFMARGKNVLIVCQKRAALDVVKKRLTEAGIGDFVSLVHDFNYDRKNIFSKIDDQISKLETYKEQNFQLDTVFLERNFQQASRRIDQLTEELESFRSALFNHSICGLSPKDLYHTCNPILPSIPIPDFRKFPAATWDGFKRNLTSYLRFHQRLGKSDYPWRDRVSFAKFTWDEKKQLLQLLPRIASQGNQWLDELSKLTKKSASFYDLNSLNDHAIIIQSILDGLTHPIRKNYVLLSPNPKLSKKRVDKLQSDWLLSFKNGLKTQLSEQALDDLILKIDGYHLSQNNIFSQLKWRLFSPDKSILDKICLAEGLSPFLKNVSAIEARIKASKDVYTQTASIQQQPWGKFFPTNQIESEVNEWFEEITHAIDLKDKVQKWTVGFPLFLDIFKQNDTKSRLNGLLTLSQQWQIHLKKWAEWVTVGQIETLITHQGSLTDLTMALENDFDYLCEFDQLKDNLMPHETDCINALIDANETSAMELFDNSIRLAWINFLEEQQPILRTVSTFRMDDMTRELQEKITEKQQLSQHIVQQKIKERVYRNTSFNRLNNRVTYRELQHQVSKKKKIWPLRKVLGEFHEEIFNLMPCWLASPESVSAIFPMEQWFDLVIFDEASQCFAEKGLPAMFRARQIVVTGDSQQLPPNDLYQVRWDDPDDESFESGVDSLLDLCARHLPQVQLAEHYRSRNPELIGFSNEHFYKNSLRLVPYEYVHRERSSAIQFVQVGGIWENHANKIEAQKVVEISLELLREHPEKELGIVTFNFRQQNMIMDLLEQESNAKRIQIPESLIVKNIENIQGDEKDIIIFSIGYAADLNGKLIMNFGTLNSDGGQNRLNVAITRAKERVIVVASVLPQQLAVEEAKHDGPRLLKKYLTYAMEKTQSRYSNISQSKNAEHWLKGTLVKYYDGQTNATRVLGLEFADLAIQRGTENMLLLTDDNRYFASLSSKDLHGYFLQRLKEKSWDYIQLFTRNFWQNFEEAFKVIGKTPDS